MDQGFAWSFNSQGIDPTVSNGVANWTDGWHKVVIVGSAPQAIKSDPTKGGRLNIKIKAVEGPDAGKEHFIGLNVFHTDPATKLKAEQEMAAICHVTGRYAFQNPAELYNIPFYIQAQLRTSKPTPEYPNPQPRTEFVAYRDLNGIEPGKNGQAQMAGGPPQGGPPQQQQQFAPQVQQAPAFNPGQPAPNFNPNPAPGPAPFNPNPGPAPFNPGGPAPAFNPAGPAPGPAPFNPNAAPPFNPGQPPQQPFQQQQAPQYQQPQQLAPTWSPNG